MDRRTFLTVPLAVAAAALAACTPEPPRTRTARHVGPGSAANAQSLPHAQGSPVNAKSDPVNAQGCPQGRRHASIQGIRRQAAECP